MAAARLSPLAHDVLERRRRAPYSASDKSMRWHCHQTASAHITARARRRAEFQQFVNGARKFRRLHVSAYPRNASFLHAPFGESARGFRRTAKRRQSGDTRCLPLQDARRAPRVRNADDAAISESSARRRDRVMPVVAQQRDELVSAVCVEWPIVQIRRSAGSDMRIHQFALNGHCRERAREPPSGRIESCCSCSGAGLPVLSSSTVTPPSRRCTRQSKVPRRIICADAGRTENGTSKIASPDSSACTSAGCAQRARYASHACSRTSIDVAGLDRLFIPNQARELVGNRCGCRLAPLSVVPNRSNRRCTSVPVEAVAAASSI